MQQLVLHHPLRKLLLMLRHLVKVLLFFKWRLHLLRLKLAPQETAQPRMALYLLYSTLGAQTQNRCPDYQLVHEICSLAAPASWNLLLLDHVLFGQNSISDLCPVVTSIGTLCKSVVTLASMS